jgi:hypothetical protein
MPCYALRSTLVALAYGAATVAAGAGRLVTLSVSDDPRPVAIGWRVLEPAGNRLLAERELTLKDGGIQGRVAHRRYRPVSLRLSGRSRGQMKVGADGLFRSGPLAAGKYDLTPIYRGGVSAGEFYSVVVAEGRTAELFPLELPATGAARIHPGAALCAEVGLSLQLTHVRTFASQELIAWAPEGGCTLAVEGLAPGEWRLFASAVGDRSQVSGEASFQVFADQATDVDVHEHTRARPAPWSPPPPSP